MLQRYRHKRRNLERRVIDGMSKSTIISSMDLMAGFYQIIVRGRDNPSTAVSTFQRIPWEWLVMSQGLSYAPATFNTCVTNLLTPVQEFAPSHFDDVFVHSRAMDGKMDVNLKELTFVRFLRLCESTSCAQISRSVCLLQTKYHFLGASSVAESSRCKAA